MALRRMSKAVKMGLTASKMALIDAGISQPEAIITGTGQGCKQDTEKFLESILDNKEGLLAPTSFIQSTHNTIGGQIALDLKSNAYNVTYTQNSGSLESALIDAQLLFLENPETNPVLVGGVDEISSVITSFLYLDEQLKQEEIFNLELLQSKTPGTITSEGAHFFVISGESEASTYAELIDIKLFRAETPEKVVSRLREFLTKNQTSEEEINLVILGNNGDSRYDHFYRILQERTLSNTQQIAYKHLSGDYNTVTGFAIWLGCKILKTGDIPQILKLNETKATRPKLILLYNHYLGENHSFILLGTP